MVKFISVNRLLFLSFSLSVLLRKVLGYCDTVCVVLGWVVIPVCTSVCLSVHEFVQPATPCLMLTFKAMGDNLVKHCALVQDDMKKCIVQER